MAQTLISSTLSGKAVYSDSAVGYSEKATKMVTYCDGSQSAKLGKAIKSATNIREHPINGNAEV